MTSVASGPCSMLMLPQLLPQSSMLHVRIMMLSPLSGTTTKILCVYLKNSAAVSLATDNSDDDDDDIITTIII